MTSRARWLPTVVGLFALAAVATPISPVAFAGPPPAGSGADHELVGRSFPSLDGIRWLADAGGPHAVADSRLTLFRWWTNGSPDAEVSVPALNDLQDRFGARGLQVVGVYHPSAPRPVTDAEVRYAVRRIGLETKVAIDESWDLLERAWPERSDPRQTSVSFLVDGDGVIRFVHVGPMLFWSADPDYATANQAMDRLDRLIDRLLD